MAQLHTHYDNLKVARDAPQEVIRAAYKTLSQKYHPDRNQSSPEAIRIIKIINAAYEVLSDPARRQEHDEWIARTESSEQTTTGPDSAFVAEPSARRPSRHHARRKTMFNMRKLRDKTAYRLARLTQKTRMALDRFSRRIFSKG